MSEIVLVRGGNLQKSRQGPLGSEWCQGMAGRGSRQGRQPPIVSVPAPIFFFNFKHIFISSIL